MTESEEKRIRLIGFATELYRKSVCSVPNILHPLKGYIGKELNHIGSGSLSVLHGSKDLLLYKKVRLLRADDFRISLLGGVVSL